MNDNANTLTQSEYGSWVYDNQSDPLNSRTFTMIPFEHEQIESTEIQLLREILASLKCIEAKLNP